MKFSFFFLILIAQFSLISYYLDKRVFGILIHENKNLRNLFRFILFFVVFFIMVSNILYRVWESSQGTVWMGYLQYTSFTAFAAVGLLFGWTLSKDIFFFAYKFVSKLNIFNRQQRNGHSQKNHLAFLKILTYLALLAAVVNTFLGLAGMWGGAQVVEVEVPIKNLPAQAVGLRIVHLSDVHVGPTIHKSYVENIVNIVNGLNPHIVCLTGDAIDGYPEQLRPLLEPFKHLHPPLGAYFVIGNHEYYWGGEEWMQEFSSLGFKTLMNSNVTVDYGSVPISISGLPDLQGPRFVKGHEQKPHKAAEGTEGAQVKILLVHQPISIRSIENNPYHLVLSGHTHAGQVFPGTLIIHLIQPFVKGLYPTPQGWLYVNQGTGYYGPPMRVGTLPEITLLKLVQAPS